MSRTISPQSLAELVGTADCPRIVDVRREALFRSDDIQTRIAGAVWRDHMKTDEWGLALEGANGVVVYCAHGHNVSELAVARLTTSGINVSVLAGGIDAYAEAGGIVIRKDAPSMEIGLPNPSVWVTRERPKIDRIACPWLIRRFIDPGAIIHFVAAEWVKDVADEMGAIPFDIDGVDYSHRDSACTFDTLLDEFVLDDPALLHLARIVRGADTATLDLEPEAPGLLALSLGLSAVETDDHKQLQKGMILYDALYGWCRHARNERHNWPSAA